LAPPPPAAEHEKVPRKLEITDEIIDRAMLEPVDTHGIRIPELVIQVSANRAGAPQETVTIDLPPLFYDDHVARGLLPGFVVKRLARNTRVELNRETFDDLRADAAHYVEMAEEFNETVPHVVISARATLRALDKAGRPK